MEFLEIYSREGEDFYERVDDALSRLLQFPESGPIYSIPFRRLLLPKTPYGIFYAIEGHRILIHAILDLRGDPQRVLQRLKRPSD